VLPLLSAATEKEIQVVSSAEMFERLVPTTTTYVSLTGLAMPIRLAAPGSETAPPYGVLVRDAPGATNMTVVMTDTDPTRLLARWVSGRVTSRPFDQAAIDAFAARDEPTNGLNPGLLLIEIAPDPDEPIVEASSVDDLLGLPDGTLVQVPLSFAAESLPTCQVADGCPSRLLAAGGGIFVHLARDLDGAPLLVQTAWPATVVPGTWQGPQVRNGDQLEDFVELPPVSILAGWGRILVQASIQDDPHLVRDRLWLGPVLLTILAGLLVVGSRLGYPYFRPVVEGSRRWDGRERGPGPAAEAPHDVPVRVSGHAMTVGGRRRHLDEAPAVLRPGGVVQDDGRVTAGLVLEDGDRVALAAHDTGLLGQVERGEVVALTGVRPAVWAHWFGTNLRLTFDSSEDRDYAARVAEGEAGSVRSPA
jgi:hypothetical protein